MESLLVVESLIALGALGCLAEADWCEYMTVNHLLVLLLAILLFIPFLSFLFLHRWNTSIVKNTKPTMPGEEGNFQFNNYFHTSQLDV